MCRIVGLEDLLYDVQEPRRNFLLPSKEVMVSLFNQFVERTGKREMSAKEACSTIFTFDGDLNTEANVKAIRKYFTKNVSRVYMS